MNEDITTKFVLDVITNIMLHPGSNRPTASFCLDRWETLQRRINRHVDRKDNRSGYWTVASGQDAFALPNSSALLSEDDADSVKSGSGSTREIRKSLALKHSHGKALPPAQRQPRGQRRVRPGTTRAASPPPKWLMQDAKLWVIEKDPHSLNQSHCRELKNRDHVSS